MSLTKKYFPKISQGNPSKHVLFWLVHYFNLPMMSLRLEESEFISKQILRMRFRPTVGMFYPGDGVHRPSSQDKDGKFVTFDADAAE